MSSAAIPPLHFPQPAEDFLKFMAADAQRYGRGCIAYVVAALRYRARLFGQRFESGYQEIGDLILTKGGTQYCRASIALALSKLEKAGFCDVRSHGRGVWIELLENCGNQNSGKKEIRLQKSKNLDPALIRNAHAQQATEVLQNRVIAINSTVHRENLSTKSVMQSENPATSAQPQAKPREPEPKGKKEPENPVGEAVEVWQMARERAVEFAPWVIALACQRMRKRFADAERRGEQIADTGAYLYYLAVCIGGKPVKRPTEPRSGSGFQSVGEVARQSRLFADDPQAVIERALQGFRERHPEQTKGSESQ